MRFLLSFEDLSAFKRKGLRNNNWHKLKTLDKAFYKACIWYARVKGRIVNERIVYKILKIVEKLVATFKSRMIQAGLAKAMEMLIHHEETRIFVWCPQLKDWLRDETYVLYLGLNIVCRGWRV